MCDVQKHGGPDDFGLFSDNEEGLVFGHRRLSIIDLSSRGHQPMSDEQHRLLITFNGEIYNYRELKLQLVDLGFKFISDTDTEVILAAYLKWGIAAFSMFRGMFAFALYDKEIAITYLVRDTTGIKPLYYHINGKQLSFASEIRAFKAAKVANESDHEWAVKFLAFGHIPEPYTTFKNVYSLEKGHFLAWNHHTCNFVVAAYPENKTRDTALIYDNHIAKKQIKDSLERSIKRQLIADAPIGVFLSGGIDSSLLTLLANEQHRNLKTISIYFDEKSYDERSYQKLILKRLDGEKFAHLVTQNDFELFFPKIMDSMDMPTTDGINTWFISKYAKESGLKAVLSGIGADELFGGYPSFSRIKYLKLLRQFPSQLFKFAKYFKTDRYRKISFLQHQHYMADYLLLRGFFLPLDIAKILDIDLREVNDILFKKNDVIAPHSYDREHAGWFESNLYMQNQLLRDTDIMSMSHGLEVRVPFLDEDFKQVVNSISPRLRFDDKQPKKLLIDSFEGLLPEEIWNRPKMGFTFPLQQWMRNNEVLSDENSYKGKMAKNLIRKFKSGEMHWSKAFALFQLNQHG